MKDERMRAHVQRALNAELSGLRTSSRQREQLYLNAVGGYRVKRKLKAGWALAFVLVLFTATAVAAVLLSHTEVIEQVAVPMALENDGEDFTQESYTNEELARLIQTLSENGITLDEDTRIMKALKNGEGYWEEEVLMEICREAFGGLFYEWSVEEKYWFETMTVKIGFKERNPYLIPGEGDMTTAEARAHAAKLLESEYGAALPEESDEKWQICEWFYAPWTDADGEHPAMWKFEYVYRSTGVTEYAVEFTRDGTVCDISEAGFHGEITQAESFSLVNRYMSDQYGSRSDWPMDAWPEYAELIAALEPENEGQWCYRQAGYRQPPEGGKTGEEAVRIAKDAVGLQGSIEPSIICCTAQGRAIYKVMLRIHFFGNENEATYDAIWSVEMDCMTGEVIDKREYRYAESDALMMYVPFSVLDNVPKSMTDK